MIPFTIINLDKPRKMRLSSSAIVEFEQTTGIKLQSIEDAISYETSMKLLWIMLKQEQDDLTFKDTLTLVDDYAEDLTAVLKSIQETMSSAFKKPEDQIIDKFKAGTIPNGKKP